MNMNSPASQAAETILDLLGGSLDDCSRALARGDVPEAQRHLQDASERLRRVRRDLIELGAGGTPPAA